MNCGFHVKSTLYNRKWFDLHHGLKTSYWDFRTYLQNHNLELLEFIEEHTDLASNQKTIWANFEENLSRLNMKKVLSSYSDYLPSLEDDYDKRDFDSFPQIIKDRVSEILEGLEESFRQFIKSIQYSDKAHINAIKLDSKARFLQFNYTPTLENLYNVKHNQIEYIHNSVLLDDILVLGHGENPKTIIKDTWSPPSHLYGKDLDIWKMEDGMSDDYTYREGESNFHSYYIKTRKESQQIIGNKRLFFDALSGIDDIHVFGHSLSQVDLPYFKEIIKSISSNVTWTVSYYDKKDIVNFERTLNNLGVNSKQLTFIPLSELQLSKNQLFLF
ncbi:bacteriophage abortive infection AbiH family protein [Arcticibacterium luteifluviistationis]|uniref:bacteriophage abortive infection AbiH family protein n=1 Tax=Arcticibacterium luteifluviistationis TaxID=1784714 RepID=UPI001E6117CC|nr:bacteriophage abortive infection AbiH family protein [Arcticibacterium luteifluviistationis]